MDRKEVDDLRAWLAKIEPPPALVALLAQFPLELASTMPEYIVEAGNVLYRYRATATSKAEVEDIMGALLRLFGPYLRAHQTPPDASP